MVQVQPWVPGEVQLLELWRQTLRQGDLTQLVTAQIHTLTKKKKKRHGITNPYRELHDPRDAFLPLTYFHLRQLHDLGKNLNGVGVGDERVHSPTVHDGGGNSLQHVSAQVNLLQLL